MRIMKSVLVFCLLGVFFCACAQKENTDESSSKSGDQNASTTLEVTEVEDRDPMIDMINVEEFHPTENWAEYSAYIQGRDAKYYQIDGGYGSDLSVSISGGHPSIQLMIMDINDSMVLRENLNRKTLDWSGTYEKSGRYTIIVSLDSRFEEKESVRTPFTIRFELTPQSGK